MLCRVHIIAFYSENSRETDAHVSVFASLMATINVSVKWGKQKYPLTVSPSDPGVVVKSQLYSLTSVPVERQKLMFRGKKIEDDTELSSLALRNGAVLMLIGSAEVLEEPVERPTFIEDLSTEDQVRFADVVPVGLQNLGNTCYLNAVLHMLRAMPELGGALERRANPDAPEQAQIVRSNMSNLFRQMDERQETLVPLFSFVQMFRTVLPQFDQKSEQGAYLQQDADDCLNQLLRLLGQATRGHGDGAPSITSQLLEGQMQIRSRCTENEEEPDEVTTEPVVKLSCHIGSDTNFLRDGVRLSLDETLTKHSPSLDRDAVYARTSRMAQLPPYLVVHFVRFFWRKQAGRRNKILRSVKFPLELDATPFCTDEYAAQLIARRAELRELRDAQETARAEQETAAKLDADPRAAAATTEAPPPSSMAALPLSYEAPNPAGDGMYELCAVVTHQGRSADGGHYLGWVKYGPDFWYRFDDNMVDRVRDDDIKRLAGGGDWHMAYLCLYRARSQ
eukprot:gnl/Trimastix_PCT/1760.p1 GENE.gnl/Trimastix_PCT/1760~~gnl/Trimastix_PCT/1760.p1  ORF type:complete len:507 (+),score=161.30 gnl/Trimastix_PCT/1760:85-1605(+)